MKKITFWCIAIISCLHVSAQQNNLATNSVNSYCMPNMNMYATVDGEVITNVAISGTSLVNNSGGAPGGPSYIYYTGQPNYTATLQVGTTYTLNVMVNKNFSYVRAWIDYNDNFTFESNELIGASGQLGAGATASFSLPASTCGTHRMRIRNVWSVVSYGPCDGASFGEIEDYDISMVSSQYLAPSGLDATAVTTTGATLGWQKGCLETAWDVHVGLAGAGAPSATISNTGVNTNPLTVSGLLPGTAYEYYVRANYGSGNLSTWAGPFAFTTSVLNSDTFTIKIGLFPNPSKGNWFNLELPSTTQANVKLFNALGQEIELTINGSTYQAVKSLPTGVYYIMVTQGLQTSKLKWSVE